MDPTITVAIITAVGVVGAAAVALLKKTSADDTAAKPETKPDASREFMIGRWQVEQVIGVVNNGTIVATNGGSDMIYQADGKFIGSQFINDPEQKMLQSGRWDHAKLSQDTFRLKIHFDNQNLWQGVFQIVNQDRIHNIEQNYDAIRVKL